MLPPGRAWLCPTRPELLEGLVLLTPAEGLLFDPLMVGLAPATPAEGLVVVPTLPVVCVVGRMPFDETLGRLVEIEGPTFLPSGCCGARLLSEPGVLLPPWRTLAT